MKYVRKFNGTPGQASVDTGGPDQLEQDLSDIAKNLDPAQAGGGIGTENLQTGAATDSIVGNRTADPATVVPAANTGSLTQLLSWLVKSVGAIIGADWKTTPTTSLNALDADVYRKGAMDTALAGKVSSHDPTFTGTVSGVTKAMVGLGNVDNTADNAKTVLAAAKLATPRQIGGVNFDGTAPVTLDDMNVYSKTALQTAGQAAVNFANLTNVPNLADGSWKPSVATRAALPLAGNTVGDQRVVLNDGDGKQAIYACIATVGNVDAQWAKVGDVDWMTEESTRVAQEAARVTAESGRVTTESGRVTAEAARIGGENNRATAEGNRVTAESGRATAEGNRVTAESGRVTTESGRATAEGNRVTAESGRVAAESGRVARDTAMHVWEAYDAGKAYVPLNKVSYLGSSYLNIASCTGVAPTVTSNWLLIAQKGADGAGSGDMLKATYDTNGNGVVDAAETAQKFAVARNINGVAFDGTQDITVPAGLTEVEYSDLSATAKAILTDRSTFVPHTTWESPEVTIYVNPTSGSDTTGNGTLATPYLTVQHAVNTIPKNLNGNTHYIRITGVAGTEIETPELGNLTIAGFYNGVIGVQPEVESFTPGDGSPTNMTYRLRFSTITLTNCDFVVLGPLAFTDPTRTLEAAAIGVLQLDKVEVGHSSSVAEYFFKAYYCTVTITGLGAVTEYLQPLFFYACNTSVDYMGVDTPTSVVPMYSTSLQAPLVRNDQGTLVMGYINGLNKIFLANGDGVNYVGKTPLLDYVTGADEIYLRVDQANGSDVTGTGEEGAPFATLTKALSVLGSKGLCPYTEITIQVYGPYTSTEDLVFKLDTFYWMNTGNYKDWSIRSLDIKGSNNLEMASVNSLTIGTDYFVPDTCEDPSAYRQIQQLSLYNLTLTGSHPSTQASLSIARCRRVVFYEMNLPNAASYGLILIECDHVYSNGGTVTVSNKGYAVHLERSNVEYLMVEGTGNAVAFYVGTDSSALFIDGISTTTGAYLSINDATKKIGFGPPQPIRGVDSDSGSVLSPDVFMYDRIRWTFTGAAGTIENPKYFLESLGGKLTLYLKGNCTLDWDTKYLDWPVRLPRVLRATRTWAMVVDLEYSASFEGWMCVGVRSEFYQARRKLPLIIEEDFINTATGYWGPLKGTAVSSGTLAVNPPTALDKNRRGVVTLRDSTTANGGYSILTSGTLPVSLSMQMEFNLRVNATRAGRTIRMGLSDQANIAAPANGIVAEIVGNVLSLKTYNASVPTAYGSTFTLVNGTWYAIVITTYPSTPPTVELEVQAADGSLLWTAEINTVPALTTPSLNFGILAAENTTDAAADLVDIDFISLTMSHDLDR